MGPTCSIIYENEPMEPGSMLHLPRNVSEDPWLPITTAYGCMSSQTGSSSFIKVPILTVDFTFNPCVMMFLIKCIDSPQ